MILRSLPSPFGVRVLRLFHSSCPRKAGNLKSPYEILKVPFTATPAEVKKSFYALSKSYHPDRNPDDPNASDRFVEISDAYSILGTPAKRQAYDREHAATHQSHHSHMHNGPLRGSYSSTSYQNAAGGRPASGLSRRRTQFRGPPPSFYRSGGWGFHSEKRRAAQDSGAPGAEEPTYDANLGGTAGGMGYGQSPFGNDQLNNIPHFDRDGHLRTHQRHDERRNRRAAPDGNRMPTEPSRTTLHNFFVIGGLVAFVVLIPGSFMQTQWTKKKVEVAPGPDPRS